MAKRRYRKNNSPMPGWFWPAVVVSSLSAIYFWKKANPGASLNPMPPTSPPT